MIIVGFEMYFASSAASLTLINDPALKSRPSIETDSSTMTYSLAVQGKNMQSILLPSGPSSMTCLPSNVSVNMWRAWSSRAKIKSSTLQQHLFLMLDRMPSLSSSTKSSSLSMFSWLDSLLMTSGMTSYWKKLFTFTCSLG